jgi:hypothetical protein
MQAKALKAQVYSKWRGKTFFVGRRHVYVVMSRSGFTAFGALDDLKQVVFKVQGTRAEFPRFREQVESEGAKVTRGIPPFDTNTGGDKSGSGTDRPGAQAPADTRSKAAAGAPGQTPQEPDGTPGRAPSRKRVRK